MALDNDTGAAEQPADDLRSILAGAVEASEKPAETPDPPAASEAPETERPTSGERARGPDGKFVSKDTAGTEDSDEPPAEGGEEDGETSSEDKSAAEPAVDVPQHWSQADKDLIASLPPEHRSKVVERYKAIEAGYTPKLQRAAEVERQFGGAAEIFAPHVEGLRAQGKTPSDIIRAWAEVETGFMNGAAAAQRGEPNVTGAQIVARLIQNYRVDPGMVAEILQGRQPQTPAPNVNGGIRTEVPLEVAQRLQALEQREQERIARSAAEANAAAQSRIEAFASEKDADGRPKHPFFSEVEADMAALAKLDRANGKTPDLADLYDRAVFANRETRQKLLAAQEAEAKRKAQADRKARAEAAQRAASSITGSPGTGQAPTEQRRGNRPLRDELNAAFEEFEAA